MNELQRIENQQMLAATLGIPDDEASTRLAKSVQVTWATHDASAGGVGKQVVGLLSRTFTIVGGIDTVAEDATVELLIQGANPLLSGARHIYCGACKGIVSIGEEQCDQDVGPMALPAVIELLIACFASARVADCALDLGKANQGTLRFDLTQWLGEGFVIGEQPVELGQLLVAGAGAVGNAFVYALALLPVKGGLVFVDPKPVTGGILNRCLCFCETDVDHSKSQRLAVWVNARLPLAHAEFFRGTVADYRKTNEGEIECLVSGIDSRGGRRQLQEELPLEVFDASTTGIEEVVFHHNHAGVEGACLACIYAETQGELEFERHVARKLHVSVTEVRTGYIIGAAAARIVARYPQLNVQQVTGMAYDSLFKQMCATQQLVGAEQKQVLAPFAFVSQLAGTVLAIELYMRRAGLRPASAFNYWRLSPWHSPNAELQVARPRLPTCSTCADLAYRESVSEVWGPVETKHPPADAAN